MLDTALFSLLDILYNILDRYMPSFIYFRDCFKLCKPCTDLLGMVYINWTTNNSICHPKYTSGMDFEKIKNKDSNFCIYSRYSPEVFMPETAYREDHNTHTLDWSLIVH